MQNTENKDLKPVAVGSIDWLSALRENVTRITVVNHSTPQSKYEKQGRVFEKWDIQVELSLQDGGRTLKVFINDRAQSESADNEKLND